MLVLFLFPNDLRSPIPAQIFICSYNLYRFAGDEIQYYKINKTISSITLTKEDIFIFNFQEIISRHGLEKIQSLKINDQKIILGNNSQTIATLVTPKNVSIIETGIIKSDFYRNMIFTKVRIGDVLYLIIDCHWPSQFHPFSSRLKQAMLLKQFVKKNSHYQIIISGDFNMLPNELLRVKELLSPELNLLKNKGEQGSFYYPKKKEWYMFDLFWVNRRWEGHLPVIVTNNYNTTLALDKNKNYMRRPKKFMKYETAFERQGPSDHLPVCLQL